MSGVILDTVKAVAGPVKTLVVDRVQEYLSFIGSYDENMSNLLIELKILCSKKQDIDAKVTEGKERLRLITREATNWVKSLHELIEREEMKELMKEDRVAEIAVKMMEPRFMKNLLKEDREIFDIIVQVVKKKCDREVGDGEVVDAEEDADYKKVAKIASQVMKDTAEEVMKFIKKDDGAVAAVKLLNEFHLEKLRKDNDEMDKILSKAEGISRKEIEHNDGDEEELLLMKHDKDDDVQPVDKSIVKEKVGIWRKHMGSMMAFLDDENFKKSLPDAANLGLHVMDAFNSSLGSDQIEDKARPHRYCGCCFIRFEGYRHRHDMSFRAEIMAKAINSLIQSCPVGPVTRLKRACELENISNDFMEGLESREELLHKVLTALKADQVNVVGVFGMGGSGKTTLAKEVAYKRASEMFDKTVVVEVSEAPNIKGIQDQIAEGINLPLDDVHTIAQRALRLYNGLKSEKKKKILIVLDNIWKKIKLDEVGIPRGSTKDFCCKLLITTRERQVCRAMDIQNSNIFEVGMLNNKEATDLFENQSGKKVDSGDYKPLVDRLLRKCGGLPLAIVAAASALRGKDLPTWCQFAEESEKPISSQVSTEYRETYSILETSYKLMENEEKKIFFFLACLSPLDSAVSIDDLMRYGIGLDLFQRVNNVLEAKEQATGWANELVSSSLLLSDESNGQVRIHDVVRASAIMFAEKGKDRMTLVESIPRWMCEETLAKFTAMSLLSGHDFSCLSGVKAPLLEILLLKGDVSLTSLASDFFGGMTNLKVLSLSNMNFKLGLPESMGQLERLKTLHLHHCQLKDIKIIGRLVNLLVLSLRESSLEELANEVGELCKLRLLDMGGCKGRISIPANILSRLSRLEGLYMFNSFNDWAYMNTEANDGEVDNKAHLAELNKLSHLTVLEMEVPKSEQIQMLHDSQLVEQLGKFKIHVGGFNKWGMDRSQSFLCSLKLENIDTSRNNCLKALLKKIDCLQAIGCGNLTENIVPQWDEEGFQDLHSLDLKYCEDVKFIISSSKQNEFMAFANLKFLRLYAMKNLEMICNGKIPAGIFSNIQRLILMSLPKLMYGLPLTILPLNLAEVDIYDCESLKFIVIDDPFVSSEKVVVQETYNVGLHLLKSLKLDKVASLSSVLGGAETFDEGAQANQPFFHAKIIFPSLEILRLTSNNKTTTLWSKACHVSGFQNLKLVDICFCAELESLGSPSIFATLVQLEELSVRHCKKLQEVITKETEVDEVREHAITFSLLKQLSMGGLSNLERFYGGTYKLEFPLLKSLTFSDFHSMMAFDGSENSTALFSDQIEFPCLEELNVQNVSNQVVSLWNWCTSDVQGKSGSEIISINPVPKLQKLTLGQTRGLASIPPFISHNLTHLLVVQFCDIKILFSTVTTTTSSEVLWAYSQLVKLEDLSIDGCDSLEELFENEDDDGAISLCGRLSSLMLSNVPKLNMIPLHLLTNLRSLCLSDLSWTYTFTADLFIRGREQLQLLQSLQIIGCQNMKVVLMDELVGDGADTVYVFPHLKNLILEELGITNFASKPNTALHFPSLEKVQLMRCNKMRSFCSGPFIAPKLEKLQILYCRKVKYFLSEKMKDFQELPSLESVNIESCPMLLSILSVPLSAPRLSEVNLQGCRKMKWFALGNPKHDDILELPFLEAVFIDSCSSMKSFSPGGIKAPELSELQIDESDYSKRANEELEHLLGNLYLCPTRDEDEYMDDEDEYTEDEDMDDELWNESNEGSEEEQIEEIMRV